MKQRGKYLVVCIPHNLLTWHHSDPFSKSTHHPTKLFHNKLDTCRNMCDSREQKKKYRTFKYAIFSKVCVCMSVRSMYIWVVGRVVITNKPQTKSYKHRHFSIHPNLSTQLQSFQIRIYCWCKRNFLRRSNSSKDVEPGRLYA